MALRAGPVGSPGRCRRRRFGLACLLWCWWAVVLWSGLVAVLVALCCAGCPAVAVALVVSVACAGGWPPLLGCMAGLCAGGLPLLCASAGGDCQLVPCLGIGGVYIKFPGDYTGRIKLSRRGWPSPRRSVFTASLARCRRPEGKPPHWPPVLPSAAPPVGGPRCFFLALASCLPAGAARRHGPPHGNRRRKCAGFSRPLCRTPPAVGPGPGRAPAPRLPPRRSRSARREIPAFAIFAKNRPEILGKNNSPVPPKGGRGERFSGD